MNKEEDKKHDIGIFFSPHCGNCVHPKNLKTGTCQYTDLLFSENISCEYHEPSEVASQVKNALDKRKE